jgi:chemosensory pili system protein ChpA (sensor histidine kinase/response regulator)
VVVLAAGGKTYALPAILVEQVLQMKEHALAEARSSGMQYLPTLLGDPRSRRCSAHRRC